MAFLSPSPLSLSVSMVLAGAFASWSCGGEEPPEELPPDVAVILIDTLRKDYLDLYGHEAETAPYLRSLGERSAVFDRAYSTSSWTAPATATVMTGLYPQRHGIVVGYNAYGNGDEDEDAEGKPAPEAEEPAGTLLSMLPGEVNTMGEVFKRNGYQTFAVASNVNLSRERGFDRGFDRFETVVQADAPELVKTMAGWTQKRRANRPAFWYLHLNDVHKPYEERDPWYEKRAKPIEDDKARYISEIRYLDNVLESLGTSLGWTEDTVVVVLADHGEEFRDHKGTGHRPKLYGELMNVPMMISAPGITDGGMRVDSAVSLIDVLPTLQDLLGLRDDSERDGVSLMPLLRREPMPARPLFAQRRKPTQETSLWAVVEGRWKLIYFEDKDRVELYNAVDDPLDKRRLNRSRPEVVDRLRELIETARKTKAMDAEQHVMDGGQAMIDHLTEMGYAGDEDGDE